MTREERIVEIDAQTNSLYAEQRQLLREWATEHCPFRVGDIVEACGYEYRGKMIRVGFISGAVTAKGLRWHVEGQVLRKDGSSSARSASFSQFNYQQHCERNAGLPPDYAELQRRILAEE